MFLGSNTLKGTRNEVYVLIKMLKSWTGADVTSFASKYAVDRVVTNIKPDEIGMGKAIKMVLEYRTVLGKFESLHPDLGRIGIPSVDVTDEGFQFVGYDEGTNT